MKALDILKQLKQEEQIRNYPSVPKFAIPAVKLDDTTANGLTKCVIEYLRLTGHFAERVNSMGRVIDNRKTVSDVIGRQKVIGSMKYIPSTGHVGTADIHSEINVSISGKTIPIAVKWEVKINKDRQSAVQKEYESKVGNYYIIKSFQDFYDKLQSFLNEYK
jgi:hypothetical protein